MDPTPKLTIRLAKDKQGNPAVVKEAEGRKHYKVVLEVDDAPSDTYAATFELDPSYYDPLRTLKPDADGKFRLETTTYGDYPVFVRLHRAGGSDVTLKDNVVRALTRTSSNEPESLAFQVALNDIAKN